MNAIYDNTLTIHTTCIITKTASANLRRVDVLCGTVDALVELLRTDKIHRRRMLINAEGIRFMGHAHIPFGPMPR